MTTRRSSAKPESGEMRGRKDFGSEQRKRSISFLERLFTRRVTYLASIVFPLQVAHTKTLLRTDGDQPRTRTFDILLLSAATGSDPAEQFPFDNQR